MDEMHVSRVGAAGLEQIPDGFFQIRDLSFAVCAESIHNLIAASDASVRAKQLAADKSSYACFLPEMRLDNHWHISGTNQDGSEKLSERVLLNVSAEEFKKLNPQFEGKGEDLAAQKSFRVRHASTGEVDAGWRVESIEPEGSVQVSKVYNIDVMPKAKHDELLEATPGVPKEHIKALEAKLAELPLNVRKALLDHGYKIIATSTNSDAIPELRGLTPRGWPAETRFDNSDGTHDNVRRLILAPVRFKTGTDFVPVDRENVVVHQIGHALDHACERLSNSAEFQKAFKEDMTKLAQKGLLMSDREKAIYKYFNQKDGPGKDEKPGSEEAFASLFGLILTGPENEEDRLPFENNFANTINVVKKQIKGL